MEGHVRWLVAAGLDAEDHASAYPQNFCTIYYGNAGNMWEDVRCPRSF
jgi:hypothetical protein